MNQLEKNYHHSIRMMQRFRWDENLFRFWVNAYKTFKQKIENSGKAA